MRKIKILINKSKALLFLLLIFFKSQCLADKKSESEKFAVTKSPETNIRTGPNKKYPIRSILIFRNEPIEIIGEFEKWKKIRDIEKEEGWIHESLISYKKRAIIDARKEVIIYKKPYLDSKKLAIIQPKVRVDILKCKKTWCKIKINKYEGWVQKSFLWGPLHN